MVAETVAAIGGIGMASFDVNGTRVGAIGVDKPTVVSEAPQPRGDITICQKTSAIGQTDLNATAGNCLAQRIAVHGNHRLFAFYLQTDHPFLQKSIMTQGL